MNETIKILDDLDTILAMHAISNVELIAIIQEYVEQKRKELS